MLRRSWRGEAVCMSSQTARFHIKITLILMTSSLLTVRSGHTAPCTGCVHERCSALCWYHLLCGGGNVRSGPYARYEDVWGSGGMTALILDLSAKFSEWSVFCSGRFTRERDHPVPIEQRTDWPHQSRSGPCEDKYRALSGNQTVISRTYWQCELCNTCRTYTRCTL